MSAAGTEGEMRRVEVKSRRRIFDDFFKIEEAVLSFERYDGRMSPVVRRLKFERGDSVAAIVIDRDKRCLYLTEQFKYPTLENGDGWIIEVVAGTREDGETAEDTLRREIEEEIGFAVEHAEPIATFYVSPGGHERAHLPVLRNRIWQEPPLSRRWRGGRERGHQGDRVACLR